MKQLVPLVARMRRLPAAAARGLLLLFLFAPSAHADDLTVCDAERTPPDMRIAACSRVIKSNRLRGRDLAIVYSNRSAAYETKGDFDHQIADAEEAVRLDSKDSDLHYNLALSYRHKGDYDRAIASFGVAIKLNPKKTRRTSRSIAIAAAGAGLTAGG